MSAPLNTEEVIRRAIAVHGDIYDYSGVVYTPRQKISVFCKVHQEYFNIHVDKHVNNGQGCPKCGREKVARAHCKNTDGFIKEATIVHGDTYSYDRVEYTTGKTVVSIFCKKCNTYFQQTPGIHLMGCGCQICGKESSLVARTKSLSAAVAEAIALHGSSYSYSGVTLSEGKLHGIICGSCGTVFSQRMDRHLSGMGCKKCSYSNAGAIRMDTTESFIAKAVIHHGDKYDYSKVVYQGTAVPVTILCKRCGENFEQIPKAHVIGKGCRTCGMELMGINKIVPYGDMLDRCIEYHGDTYTYTEPIEYHGAYSKIEITCKIHGPFLQAIGKHAAGQGCPSCVPRVSRAERELADWIESLGIFVDRGNASVLYPRHIDVYMPDRNFGIEYNGLYFHNETDGRNKTYHLEKTEAASAKGIHLMQFWDIEWNKKQDIVKSVILNKLGIYGTRYFARKLKVHPVLPGVARIFCENNHLHGFRGGSNYIGLYNVDELVALMITAYDGELVRFVVKTYTTVIGGFSKLLKYSSVRYSFVDRRVFTGSSYTANGFILDSVTPPNYYYTKDYRVLESRNKYQKHKLDKLLPEFNPDISEVKNMQNNGYVRVFDCGNLKFTYPK